MRSAWPITVVDGEPTIPIKALHAMFRHLERLGRVRDVFYDGGIGTPEAFAAFMLNPQNMPVVIVHPEHGAEMLSWLNGIEDGSAKIHFCGLDRYRKGAGEAALAYFDQFLNDFGEPMFRVLVGVTPETNEPALRLSRILGFQRVGTIPQVCHMVYENRRVGGVLSYRERR